MSAPVNLPGGAVQHNITGGTRPGSGGNLFHSFGEFGVPTNNIANFLNDSGLSTNNVLSRVTGGNPSNILGSIQTEGFGNANLFLMNPAGIVFGPNASLNVGGATHFTTADYLRLADGVQFTALPSAQDALLSIAPVAAFGFLGTNPGGGFSVEGSALSVVDGQTLSLVGGDITIGNSALSAPGGQIAIVSVASPGEVVADTFDSAPNVNGQSFTTMGNIVLSDGATLDVSGDAAGTVIFRGGQLMMTDATISADTENQNGAATAVDIQVTGDISMTATQTIPAITARTTGEGHAGGVRIAAGNNMDVTTIGVTEEFSLIDTHTSGVGTGGHVKTNVSGNLKVTGNPLASTLYFIDSGTQGFEENQGGDIMIRAGNIQLQDTVISSGDRFSRFALNDDGALGSGGNAMIVVDNVLQLSGATIDTAGFNGKAGDLTLSARDIQLKDSGLSLLEYFGGGGLTITADRLVADNSLIELETVDGQGSGVPWTGVTINLEVMELRNGSAIRSQTVGNGAAGDMHITATEHMLFSDDPLANGTDIRPSGLFTNSLGDLDLGLGNQGPAGSIVIETAKLEMSGGARINSSTQNSGRGGDITITTNDSISLTGQRDRVLGEILESDLFGVGSTLPSGIYSRTVGSEPDSCTGFCGDAGNISITTGFLNMTNGAAINSGTASTGQGGSVNVNASGNISISGTLDDGTAGGVFSRTTGREPGSGAGGAIALTAGQNFTLSDGATVSASSDGPGNAGNINVTAHDTMLIDQATVTAEAAQASGGNIKLTANDTIQLTDSTISSSVQGDPTTVGGDVTLDPDFIILQNSQILAKAVAGKGGNIDLVASKAVLLDAQSTLNASSQTGISGSVTIESPIQVLSGTIAPLPSTPVNVATLYAARCVAGEGGHFSTFVDSKSDSVAPTPGTFLASPFLPQVSSSSAGALGHADTPAGIAGTGHAASIQVAAYATPVLFQHGDGMLSACP